jgi:hypothetical protein
LIPEFKDTEILKGFEKGTEKPILVKSTKNITLRQVIIRAPSLRAMVFVFAAIRIAKWGV